MSPAIIAMIIQIGLTYGPEMFEAVKKMFSKPPGVAPTEEEWNQFKAHLPKDMASYYADAEARAAALRSVAAVASGKVS